MRTVEVVVGLRENGEEIVDRFNGPYGEFSWITEPSGVLSVVEEDRVVHAFAPGAWLIVRYRPEEES